MPEWDLARTAPTIPQPVLDTLWNRHAHQRLSAHRFQELMADLVELLHDPAINPGQHPAAAARARAGGHPCMSEHLAEARDCGLPHAVAGLSVLEVAYLEEIPTHRPLERAVHLLPRPRTVSEALDAGWQVDSQTNPPTAYKGPRFTPDAAFPVRDDLPEHLRW